MHDYLVLIVIFLMFLVFTIILNNLSINDIDHFDMSNEAIQNVISVYNKDNMTISKLNATNSITTPTITSTDYSNINGLPIMRNWNTDYNKYKAQMTDSKEAGIANDFDTNKTLMIVGNNSGGGSRKIGLWDDVTVNGGLTVNGGIRIGKYLLWDNGGNFKIENLESNGSKIFQYDSNGVVSADGLKANDINKGLVIGNKYTLWGNDNKFKIEYPAGKKNFYLDDFSNNYGRVSW